MTLAHRRFRSERVASVALQLVAGERIEERRRRLREAPQRTLAERSLSWRGSRYAPGMEGGQVRVPIEGPIRTCVEKRLIPDAGYRVRVQREQAYGISGNPGQSEPAQCTDAMRGCG